jgi:hypothetical protein
MRIKDLTRQKAGNLAPREQSRLVHAAQGCSRRYRSVEPGYFASIAGGRIGRLTKLPWQFGHTPAKTVAAQPAQNVHSKVQIRASGLSGGRSRSQHSQFGFSFIMAVAFSSNWLE